MWHSSFVWTVEVTLQLFTIFDLCRCVQHLHVMEDMLKDFLLGEHLLLVGNQGVGKNKIVDRFLHLLNRPREYIQLHRYSLPALIEPPS